MSWVDPAQELAAIRRWFDARDLELELFERSDGRWRAMVTAAGEPHGSSEYVEAGDELGAALSGLAQVAQSEVVQLLAAEMLISRIPGGRSKAGRRAALASAVWMLDPKRRTATRTAGRMAGEWARLRIERRTNDGSLPHPEALLPAALGATERKLDQRRLRLRHKE